MDVHYHFSVSATTNDHSISFSNSYVWEFQLIRTLSLFSNCDNKWPLYILFQYGMCNQTFDFKFFKVSNSGFEKRQKKIFWYAKWPSLHRKMLLWLFIMTILYILHNMVEKSIKSLKSTKRKAFGFKREIKIPLLWK